MSHFRNVTVKISGLEPNASYDYAWVGLGGNWPALIGSKSGVMASDAYNSSYEVNTAVQFCATTGSCIGDSALLPYSTENCDVQSADVFSVLELVIKSQATDSVVLTKNVRVVCEECTNKPTINATYTNTLNSLTGNRSEIKVNLTKLIPQKTYYYKFISVDGNWPVTISNLSGSFVPAVSDATVYSSILFNEATGIVSDNVFNNEVPQCLNDTDFNATISFELVSQDDCDVGQKYTSQPLTFNCRDCLGNLSIEPIGDINLTQSDGHFAHINAVIRNCQKNNVYNYQFHSAGGNWPVNINNISGSFIANDIKYSLTSLLSFCQSDTLCDVNNNSVLTPKTVCLTDSHRMNTLYLYVEPANCQLQSGASNQFHVHCDDCFIDPKISMGLNGNMFTGDYDITVFTSSQVQDLNLNFTNLVKGSNYAYSFEGIDGNWPVILDPPSGEFRAKKTNETRKHKVLFALPTGDALNNPGALYYNISSYNQEYEHKFSTFHTVLHKKDCEGAYYESVDFELTCKDCLPCLNCTTVSFSGSPILNLPLSCCSGTDMMFVSITGANPDEVYRYELTSLSGQISFVPHTGMVYMGKTGSTTVPVLMTTKLTNREQGLAQATLTDIGSGAETLGFLGILCGEECNTDATYRVEL